MLNRHRGGAEVHNVPLRVCVITSVVCSLSKTYNSDQIAPKKQWHHKHPVKYSTHGMHVATVAKCYDMHVVRPIAVLYIH
jgi:hypothetical protein